MHVVILLSFLSPPLLFWGIDDILCKKKKKKRGWSVRFSFPPFKKKEGRKRRKIGHRRRKAKKRGRENVGKNRMVLIIQKKKLLVLFISHVFCSLSFYRHLHDDLYLTKWSFFQGQEGEEIAIWPPCQCHPSILVVCAQESLPEKSIFQPVLSLFLPRGKMWKNAPYTTPFTSSPKTPTPFFYYPRNLRDKWTLRRGEGRKKHSLYTP